MPNHLEKNKWNWWSICQRSRGKIHLEAPRRCMTMQCEGFDAIYFFDFLWTKLASTATRLCFTKIFMNFPWVFKFERYLYDKQHFCEERWILWVVMIPQLNLGQDLSGQRVSTLIRSNLVLKSILHLLGMHLSCSYRKKQFFHSFHSVFQEAIKRSWWTSDTWSSTQIGSQLKASRTTWHTTYMHGELRVDQVSIRVSILFFGGGLWGYNWQLETSTKNTKKDQKSPFSREKNHNLLQVGWPRLQGLEMSITKEWMMEDWVRTPKKHRN